MPFFFTKMLFDGIARFFERVRDLLLPSLDDPGSDERAAGREKLPRERRERQYNVCNDVRKHNIKPRAERGAHPLVREDVPGIHTEPVGADAVERGIVHRHVRRFGIDVAADGLAAAEYKRADGENAAAAAEIQHALAAPGKRFDRLETHARRGVAAGAEDEARIEPQRHAPVGGLLLPRGDDDELFPDGQGLIILLPVVFPVLVGDDARFDAVARRANRGEYALALRVAREPELHARHAGEALLERFVHIVPAGAVILQKIVKIPFVFYAHSADAELGERAAELLRIVPAGNGAFQPLHGSVSFIFFMDSLSAESVTLIFSRVKEIFRVLPLQFERTFVKIEYYLISFLFCK